MTIRIVLADDQALLRKGFRMILEAEDDLEIVGEAADGADAVRLVELYKPDVVLMDVRMPVLDGIEATRAITEATPGDETRVLILTTFDLDEYAFSALRAGASGFLLKDVPPAELVAAIRTVARGDAVVSPRITRRLLEEYADTAARPLRGRRRGGGRRDAAEHAALAQLTEREREVLLAVADGLSNAEIAERLYVSEATVKSHVGRLLAKLGLRDRVQAVVFAFQSGLVRPSSSAVVTAPDEPAPPVAADGDPCRVPRHRARRLHRRRALGRRPRRAGLAPTGWPAVRARLGASLPRLTRRRTLPPGRRLGTTVWHLGGALGLWYLKERRRGGEASIAGISRRLRVAAEKLGPDLHQAGPDHRLGRRASSRPSSWPSSSGAATRCPPEPWPVVERVLTEELGGPISVGLRLGRAARRWPPPPSRRCTRPRCATGRRS